MSTEKYKKIGIILIITAIGLGSLATHYLKEILSINELKSVEIGIRYQLFHGLSLLILALNAKQFNQHIKKSLVIMTIGICFFSFSIYLLNLQRLIDYYMYFLGPLTPIGGFLLIISWIILFFSVKKID